MDLVSEHRTFLMDLVSGAENIPDGFREGAANISRAEKSTFFMDIVNGAENIPDGSREWS